MSASDKMAPELVALLNKEKVPQSFMDWMAGDDVGIVTVRHLAASASTMAKVDSDLIEASGVTPLTFANKLSLIHI